MKDQTRTHIIQTASELFYSKGYNLTGINEIIAKAGIAKATLYSHFRSKEDLCIAYLDARDQELLEEIEQFCSKRNKGNDQLIAVLEFLIPFFKTRKFNGCWCIRTAAEIPRENKKIKAKIRQNKTQFLSFIENLVKRNKGRMKQQRQEALARKIYLLYEGAVTESHLQQKDWPIHENIDILKGILNYKS